MKNSQPTNRFRRVPRQAGGGGGGYSKFDPLLDENLEQWPHLNELVQCYKTDWIKDDQKYGHYESVGPVAFQNQIFEGPDTDIETEVRLASARQVNTDDATDDDVPTTSGRQFADSTSSDSKHFGPSPLPAYEPAFDWQNERSMIYGQRIPDMHISHHVSVLKISVKVLSLVFQAGLVEPFHGSISLWNRERREKMSEDFYFRVLPSDSPIFLFNWILFQGKISNEPRGVFYLDAPSASVCLLIQLEKPATEEGGVTSSVYSRKEPVFFLCFNAMARSNLTERERQKLQVWSRIMPYRESFAWAILPLFDNIIGAASNGSASPSSPLAPGVSGPILHDGEPATKITMQGKVGYSSGSSVVIEISNLNKVKESYTEDSLQDPKRKVHRPVRGVLRQKLKNIKMIMLILNIYQKAVGITNDSFDPGDSAVESTFSKSPSNGSDGVMAAIEGSIHLTGKSCLNTSPIFKELQSSVLMKVELRKDDADVRRLPLEALYPREPGVSLQKWVHTQTKLEAPKPVVIGYAALLLSTHAQSVHTHFFTIMRELVPHYLQDTAKIASKTLAHLVSYYEQIRDFFLEYDRHTLRTSPPWVSELIEAINSLKNVDSTALLQFLHPILNMLLHLIGNGGETLQVAAFRAVVNILTRAQQESVDDNERNRFLVNYVDYAFDDFGGCQPPVYPGLSAVWGSLARSKAKGYRVGPVYDDVLAMAWFFLELIVKSMALEQTRLFYHVLSLGEDIPPMQLKEGVFKCISQLYDCLLTEVHERCKKGLSLAKRLTSSLAFFCYDLLSVIEPRQVFELVSLYFDKFSGMPGRDPSDRNYLSSMLIQEIFLSWDHDDLSQRAKAARILVVLLCKHEFDSRYQKPEDKLYIAQLYFPLIGQILDEMPVFYNLNAVEKREVLIVILQIVRNLDDSSLVKAWQQSIARTRLFFKLVEECLTLLRSQEAFGWYVLGSSSRSPAGDGPVSPKYSDKLSPAIITYLSEASRQEVRPQGGTPESGYTWQRVNSQLSSPSQPYSLREALAQAQSSRIGASAQALRESLHPLLRQKLELWEENLSAAVSLQVLEVTEKFSAMASTHGIATDYGKLDCITAIFMNFFSRNQPLVFWRVYPLCFTACLISMEQH
ncbi:hypothetical protein MLD38_026273 [Melastoma candidum]|uniref:Uncharacterized protein n=1 Tax=Melastoma candidum TaxID=119954 RepID=A0ACB9NZW5_9MYRT|nr:hypothetical protein MLD38_026273 [Melastoma candidum]